MKKILRIILIGLIVVTALFLRTYRISSIPPSLSWDEVSIGYNAYSILKTNYDEHGKFLPLDTFVAYGDYKPPLAIYVTIPFVAILGLNELSVRLPSALFGTMTVFLTFFLVKELFRFFKGKQSYVEWLSILASALLAISPWHINLSRAGFEANIALFFIVLGVIVVLRARQFHKYWYIAWIPFVLSVYTFNSARYFAPLFSFILCVVVFNDIQKQWKKFSGGVLIAIILLLPIIPHLLSKEARLRFTEVNIFTDASVVIKANERMAYDNNSFVSKIIHNRRFGYALSYLRHFADNLQPSFLFIQGDGNPKFSTRVVGQLYMIEAPLLGIGILSMFSLYPKIAWILLSWIILAILPAATARETPHALRILNSLPTWQIFIAFGCMEVISTMWRVHKKYGTIVRTIGIVIIIGLYGFSIGYYLHNYYAHYPVKYSGEWQYGYREAIQFSKTIENQYDTVYLSSSIGRPYMYTLFYLAYDPTMFIQTKTAFFDSAGFYHVNGFGKYSFIDGIPTGGIKAKSLYITDPGWVPSDARILHTVTLLNGESRLVIFDKP